VPILAVSASTRLGQKDRLASAGFTDFVGKPIDPDVLLGKLAATRHSP
jgi:CheY-like chemotaxis protein